MPLLLAALLLTVFPSSSFGQWRTNFDSWIRSLEAQPHVLSGVRIPERWVVTPDSGMPRFLRDSQSPDFVFFPVPHDSSEKFLTIQSWAAAHQVPASFAELSVDAFRRSDESRWVRIGDSAVLLDPARSLQHMREVSSISHYLSTLDGWEARPHLMNSPTVQSVILRSDPPIGVLIQDWTRAFNDPLLTTADLFVHDRGASELNLSLTQSELAHHIGSALADWVQHTGLYPSILSADTLALRFAWTIQGQPRGRHDPELRWSILMRDLGELRPVRALFAAGLRDFSGYVHLPHSIVGGDVIRITDPALRSVTPQLQQGFRERFHHWTGVDVGISTEATIQIPRSSAALAPWLARERKACVVKALLGRGRIKSY